MDNLNKNNERLIYPYSNDFINEELINRINNLNDKYNLKNLINRLTIKFCSTLNDEQKEIFKDLNRLQFSNFSENDKLIKNIINDITNKYFK